MVRVDASASAATQLAVHACAGLYNRELGGSVFVQTDANVPQSAIDGVSPQDELWLPALGLVAAEEQPYGAFLSACVQLFGCARYHYGQQHEILPGILTAAAAVGVVPLADDMPERCLAPKLDALQLFAGKTSQLQATQLAADTYLQQTTGLAMLNPGYNRTPKDLANPDLSDDMPVSLVDLVFARKLFVAFLINGCTAGHPERALLSAMVRDSPWPKPVGVYGYNDSWLTGGYVWEAQTRCLDSANMGAIPTRTTNLSFFSSRRPPITAAAELPALPPLTESYDPQRTYVAFVVGDGDNVRYIMSSRKDWLQQRLKRCAKGASGAAATGCPPLSWTISPHLVDLAPDVLRWYFEAAQSTGADVFMLPPSGHLYAYPARMPDADQQVFVAATEQAGRILGSRSVVHWEWFDGWPQAIGKFLPRYARPDGQIRGVFTVNVPYLLEAFPDWPTGQTHQLLQGTAGQAGQVAVFRPQSWRGIDGSDDFHPTPQAMADRLGSLPKGTVTWVYMTSDGGLNLENAYFALLPLLPPHVRLVTADAAAELALVAGK